MSLSVVITLLASAAMAWKGFQLRRAPRDPALWIVELALLTLLASVLLSVWADALRVRVGPVVTAVLLAGSGSLFSLLILIFFHFAERRSRAAAVRSARWQLIPALVVFAIQASAILSANGRGLRIDSFPVADFSAPEPIIYYVSENLYLFYAVGLAAIIAGRFGRRVDRRTRRGLYFTSLGLGICSLAGAVRVVSVGLRVASYTTVTLDIVNLRVLGFGVIAFFVGVSYPGVTARAAAIRRWEWQRRVYHQLDDLWTELSSAFPENNLAHYPDVGAGRLWQKVGRRLSRRIVECRDGLVRISPHLAVIGVEDGDDDIPRVAAALRRALDERRAGRTVAGPVLRILQPREDRLDADVDCLVQLSAALARIRYQAQESGSTTALAGPTLDRKGA